MDLNQNLAFIRKEFPILEKCVYLISNSLGAVPRKTKFTLEAFYQLWAEEGVSAWDKKWWNLSQELGDAIASLIGAGKGEVTMMTHATQCHWVALSTQFKTQKGTRDKIVMTDHDFPSILYAVSRIAECMGWKIELVRSNGRAGLEAEEIIRHLDKSTLFVATSHVYFRSSFIQDIGAIASQAKQVGALTLIDGYHAPGVIPVDVKTLGVDFYVGGCLKWLCGGPGNAFLYVEPELAAKSTPYLVGWLAHQNPFSFDMRLQFSSSSYKFMSGTPPVPCLYTALSGLEIIEKIGIEEIRKKSLSQTQRIIKKAVEHDYVLFTPEEKEKRGGAVSIAVPHAFQVKQALEEQNIKVDFRKGKNEEPDVIRVGPHFYTLDHEIDTLFEAIRVILDSHQYKQFSDKVDHVT